MDTQYDFNELITINERIKEIHNLCSDDFSCWGNEKGELSISEDGKVLIINVNTGKEFGFTKKDQLKFSFGIDYSNPLI